MMKTKSFLAFISVRRYEILAGLSFFFMTTAQSFWSTIHGDGAVYATLIRQVAQNDFLSPELLSWSQTDSFAEHPYLFFYFGAIFAHIFGYSDLALKLPNYFLAGLSVWLLYFISKKRHFSQPFDARGVGLIAGYALLLNVAYMMQISQPTLDPLVHLFALAAVLFVFEYEKYFFGGFLMGLALLTKGVEVFPHLAALCISLLLIKKIRFSEYAGILLKGGIAIFLLVAAWLLYDRYAWQGAWVETYWQRQFASRFLTEGNMSRFIKWDFLHTVAQTYLLELIIIFSGCWAAGFRRKLADSFFIYFILYFLFNTLAFLIIKKDSSQHMTGVVLFGAVFVSEALWSFWKSFQWRPLKLVPVVILVITLSYWFWFSANAHRNPDVWTIIKNKAREQAFAGEESPIIVRGQNGNTYGLFYTAQWYFYPRPVYLDTQADLLHPQQDIYLIEMKPDFKITKTQLKSIGSN